MPRSFGPAPDASSRTACARTEEPKASGHCGWSAILCRYFTLGERFLSRGSSSKPELQRSGCREAQH